MIEFEVQGESGKKVVTEEELQRTEQWYEDRRGRLTGSRIAELMKTSRAGAKKSWNDIEKVFDFGDTAVKYIYKTIKEGISGNYEHVADSFSMRHGRENEALVKKAMIEKGIVDEVIEHGFVKYLDNLGSSPDGEVMYDSLRHNLEIKSPTSWNGHFERVTVPFDEKHKDFWQVQTEMLSLDVDRTLFVVTEPMSYTDFDLIVTKASPIHQKRILQRAGIVHETKELMVEKGLPFNEAFHEAIYQFKENQNG